MKPPTRRLAAALLALVLPIPALPAAAAEPEAERWYEVELIVFAHADKRYLEAEVWPEEVPMPPTAKAVALIPAAEQPPQTLEQVQRFQHLGLDELRMTGAFERMQASSLFEPLLHVGWRQPGMPLDNPLPVYLHSDLHAAADAAEALAPAPGGDMEPALAPIEDTPMAAPRLEGTIALKLGRYLHLDTDLIYRLPREEVVEAASTVAPGDDDLELAAGDRAGDDFPPLVLAEPVTRDFRLNESRRMRSGELHYLDHPLFGLVARVTPYEPPAVPEAAPTVPDQPANAPAATPAPTRGGAIQR